MLLDCVEQHGQRFAAVHLQVYDRMAAGMTTKELELARVNGNGLRLDTRAVYDGGQRAGPAELRNIFAEHGARLYGKRWSTHGDADRNTGSENGLTAFRPSLPVKAI